MGEFATVNSSGPDRWVCPNDRQLSLRAKAEYLEGVEQERIGRLVDKLDNMKKNAIGNGNTQCILCGDEFKILGASPTYCDDCAKAVCSKCGVDTVNSNRVPLWLCKICAETREVNTSSSSSSSSSSSPPPPPPPPSPLTPQSSSSSKTSSSSRSKT
ncbi:Rab effector noc2 [Plakobranchus ocellatus]|uniref:Rab effector noc2 n=1 Tax=Plakobranchus ocellatus TaxID=259542 RepID=A0AAV4AKJ8_9GAST|nr:Rab effector noc2 [Plakobranchus ocellatus]